jgi:PPP family 3-phenylpropionic acid transporter
VAAGRRILVAYLVYFVALGAAFPYLPVFYHDLGLGLAEIGALTAIQAAIQLVLAPVWGGLADRFPRTRLTLPLAAVVATIGATILFRATDFGVVLAGSVVLYGGMAGIGPTLDARTLETLGTARRSRYGEVRAFGSLAFVLATLAVGFLLDAEGARSLFWVYIPFLIGTVVVTASIPRRGATRSTNILRGATSFLVRGRIALFFIGVVVVWSALAAANAFYSIQIVALGGSAGLVGIAWSIGAFIEVPYMYAFPRIAKRFRTERLVVAGSVAFAARAFLAAFVSDPAALVVLAPLEGFGFASVFVGGVTVVAERAPAGLQGTAQGLFAASTGLATIIGSLVGGVVAGLLGIEGLFAVSGLIGLVGSLILGLALIRPASVTAAGS